jgi:type VI secretion system protein ImpB
MAKSSSQKFIERNRPPRVQIEYEVETGGAMKMVELPFVVGVMGDYSGQPEEPPPPIRERKFEEFDVDPKKFDQMVKKFKPRLAFRVANKLTGKDDDQMAVELRFAGMADFSPEAIVRQVGPLRELLDARDALQVLKTKLDGNDRGSEVLKRILQDPEQRGKLAAELGIDPAKPESAG